MKILLTSKLNYLPALNGASKSDRSLVEGLARRGHHCRAVVPAHSPASNVSARTGGERRFLAELAQRAIDVRESEPGLHSFKHNGVEVSAVVDFRRLDSVLTDQIREFRPDWILVSEDHSYICLATALVAHATSVVYLCHSQATLPFGPESFAADAGHTALLHRTAGIVTVSRYLKDYLLQWGGLDAALIAFPVYGQAPFEFHGRFDRGCVTLANPSQIKGIEIFQQLGRARTDLEFAAVPAWATRDGDRRALQRIPNVQLFAASENIDEIFARTRVLLMPSLWGEACLLPTPVVPDQELTPWLAALDELLSNRASYEDLSAASRQAALAFVATVDVAHFENHLEKLSEGRTPVASRHQEPLERP